MTERFAVYFAPPPGSTLEQAAAAWLGRNPRPGGAVPPRPAVPGLSPNQLHDLTAAPRTYGFHATLKPPFRLAEDARPEDVKNAAQDLAAAVQAFSLPQLAVGRIAGFVALLLQDECPELHRLAGHCVRHFEFLRAPLTAGERARRRPERLSDRRRQLLDAWGYPYVLDEFRFHMTLTGKLDDDARDRVLPVLADHFAVALRSPILCDALTVFRQPSAGAPFETWARFPFG